MKFSVKDFFSKCDQIHSFLQIQSHLLKKSSMKNFIFCTVICLVCFNSVSGYFRQFEICLCRAFSSTVVQSDDITKSFNVNTFCQYQRFFIWAIAKPELLLFIIQFTTQADNQKFFRAGEALWNQGTSINILDTFLSHFIFDKKYPSQKCCWFFFLGFKIQRRIQSNVKHLMGHSKNENSILNSRKLNVNVYF